jgi:hypothetical protein
MHHFIDNNILENAAYIAIGADAAWCEADTAALRNNWSKNAGHVEYISECIEHAEMLERLFDEKRKALCECAGVFAYEVCEPFGHAYGTKLIAGESPDAEAIARPLVDAIMLEEAVP